MANTFKLLKEAGRVELLDFAAILRPHEALLDEMVRGDLEHLEEWIVPLRESLSLWSRFSSRGMSLMVSENETFSATLSGPAPQIVDHYSQKDRLNELERQIRSLGGVVREHIAQSNAMKSGLDWTLAEALGVTLESHEAHLPTRVSNLNLGRMIRRLDPFRNRRRRETLRPVLADYLGYVNANLILADQLEVGFHDWQDFMPFYSVKLLGIGRAHNQIDNSRRQAEQLFSIPFPEFAIQDPEDLLRILNDRRVEQLRGLIASGVRGEISFDETFAKATLQDVLRIERTAQRWRNVIGYLTMPISLIPWVGWLAEKAVGEAASAILTNRLRRKHRWFYMLSETVEGHRASDSDR